MAIKDLHQKFVEDVDALSKKHGTDVKKVVVSMLRRVVDQSRGSPLRMLAIMRTVKPQIVKRAVTMGLQGKNHAAKMGRKFGAQKMAGRMTK